MDKAFWGTMRWGYFRWSVYRDDWDRLLARFKSTQLRNPAVFDVGRFDMCRFDVLVDLFDELKKRLEAAS